jgi:nuclear transport factor 2 (NTF2) superfamily protein/predicted SnoaL-like aldol condensation-catalyzing enzyme
MSNRKQQVVAVLKAIETGAAEPLAIINPDKYTQHNLAAADGLAGLRVLLAALPEGSAHVSTVRVFEDGDYVFAHTDYNFFGPKAGFDIFRFENGKIVEHWDNLQETVRPNLSGHGMIDGPTEPRDQDKTYANKELVRAFVDDILVKGRMEKLAGYFDAGKYIQHNPQIADNLSGLGSALQAMADRGITMKYDRVHKVLGEGNFVLAVSEGAFGGKQTSFYDLFRVENGKLAEHWDTAETIPSREQWKNGNGKFGFREEGTAATTQRPPLPPFTSETAIQKVRLAEDAWNSRDPEKVALAYTVDSRWRNRSEFVNGRQEIVAFLRRKWTKELDYRLIKELWAFERNRIAVRFAYEWHDDSGNWFRSYGNENWEFDENGLMRLRLASINDLSIKETDRKYRWVLGRRPDDHPGLSDLGL